MRSGPGASVPPTRRRAVSSSAPSAALPFCADPSPAPLVSHLDAQLNTLRAEISGLYRTQAAAQNKQLALSDALRDRDEEVRGLREEVRQLRETRDTMTRREQNTNERLRVKDDDAKVRHEPAGKALVAGWG
jgi:septal ring factor EnvC (AmiA/AmiB activator)